MNKSDEIKEKDKIVDDINCITKIINCVDKQIEYNNNLIDKLENSNRIMTDMRNDNHKLLCYKKTQKKELDNYYIGNKSLIYEKRSSVTSIIKKFEKLMVI